MSSSSCLTSTDLLLLTQTSTRSPQRHTSNHMTPTQCEKLVDLCRQYYDIISDTGNSIESRTQRRRIWEYIALQLNEKGHTAFTAAQYKKKYQNLKTSLKAKMNAMKKAQANPEAAVPSFSGHNNNNIGAIKKISDASSNSPSTSAFGSPVGFAPLSSQLSLLQSSAFFNPPSASTATSSLLTPAPQSLSAALAAATAPAAAAAAATGSSQQIFAPIPQMGISSLNLQSLMSTMVANEQAAAAAAAAAGAAEALLSPALVQSPTSDAASDAVMSSPGAELAETLALADADPVDVFCMSLAESLARIKSASSLLYTQLKRQISIYVLESEIKLLQEQDAAVATTSGHEN